MAQAALRDRASIVGLGATAFSRASNRTPLDLATEAALGAVADAGLEAADIDGLVTFFFTQFVHESVHPFELVRSLGMRSCNLEVFNCLGGTWACSAVAVAAMAVATGQCEAVLVYRAYNGRSERPPRLKTASGPAQWLDPFGVQHAAARFGPAVTAHMERFGTTSEDLGRLAVLERSHAMLNQKAMRREPLTLEEHQASPWLVYPFRVADCCLTSDGGVAVVVTSTERARDLRHSPVPIVAVAGGTMSTPLGTLGAEPWQTNGVHAAPRLYEAAGIAPGDLSLAELYDPFTGLCLLHIEDFGLAEAGGAAAAIRGGEFGLDGRLPLNTHGGLLCEAATNGLGHVYEAVQQLRRDGVVDDGCSGAHDYDRAHCRQVEAPELALVCGETGDSSLILRAER